LSERSDFAGCLEMTEVCGNKEEEEELENKEVFLFCDGDEI
jgi:hypothetical protein